MSIIGQDPTTKEWVIIVAERKEACTNKTSMPMLASNQQRAVPVHFVPVMKRLRLMRSSEYRVGVEPAGPCA
jgi:hypothetical protein